jgi:hypothetical protein
MYDIKIISRIGSGILQQQQQEQEQKEDGETVSA